MSELESNSRITTTFKAGKGYEAPWIVLRADTESDLEDLLGSLDSSATLEAVVTIANRFGKLYIDAQPAPTPPPPAPERNNAPPVYNQQAQQPTTGGLQVGTPHPFIACPCGEPLRFKKAGAGKFGPYSLYECQFRTGQNDTFHTSKFENQ